MEGAEHTATVGSIRDVDGVVGCVVSDGMGMVLKPFRNWIGTYSQDLTDSKPAEEHVVVRRFPPVLVTALSDLDLTEPTKEQEQVFNPYLQTIEVALRAAVLAERGQPTGLSAARRGVQVGIEVSRCISAYAAASEVCDKVSNVYSAWV